VFTEKRTEEFIRIQKDSLTSWISERYSTRKYLYWKFSIFYWEFSRIEQIYTGRSLIIDHTRSNIFRFSSISKLQAPKTALIQHQMRLQYSTIRNIRLLFAILIATTFLENIGVVVTITMAAAASEENPTNATTAVCPEEGAAVEACLLDQNNETDDRITAACDACLVSATESPPPFFNGVKNCPNLTASICQYASTLCRTECGSCHDEWSRALVCAMNTILSQHVVSEIRLCVPIECSGNVVSSPSAPSAPPSPSLPSSSAAWKWSILLETIAITTWLMTLPVIIE
jgi:hypothetical protein